VVGFTELGGSKLKRGKGFLKPNFELGPNEFLQAAKRDQIILWIINEPGSKKVCPCLYGGYQ
jgi:hypothetical protein